jgi:hypothetical protein
MQPIKSYFIDIQWYDYPIYLIYILLFLYLIDRFGKVAFSLPKMAVNFMKLTFLFYSVVLIADSFLDFMPYLPDTEMYTYMIKSSLYPETSSVNVLALYYFSLVIAILCLNSPVIFTFFSVFFYIIGTQFLISRIKSHSGYDVHRQQSIMSAMLLIWPAGLMYVSVPLREAYLLLAMCIFVAGFLSFLRERKLGLLITGSILLILLRVQMFVCLAPLAGLLIVLKGKFHLALKAGVLTSAVVLVLVFLRYMVLGEPFSAAALSDLRNEYIAEGGDYSYGNVYWQSYGDMLLDLPFLILQFILSPLPVFSSYNTSHMFLANADMVFVLIILLIILADIRYHLKNHAALLSLALVFSVVFALYEYHLTGAVRHRMPMVIMLMIPASATLARLTRKKHEAN